MPTKYKTQTTRYRAKLKKPEPLKVVITSPYKLTTEEINDIKKKFPKTQNIPLENIVDDQLLAGVIIRIGTERIDLSLSAGLNNLKHFLYEQS